MPGFGSHRVDVVATVDNCFLNPPPDRVSSDPAEDKAFTVACHFTVNGKSHSFTFQSAAVYSVGETFAMQANPRRPEKNSMQEKSYGRGSILMFLLLGMAWLLASFYVTSCHARR